MQDVFRFHPLAIEDTQNRKQRPKVEDYGDHLFLILNSVKPEPEGSSGPHFQELDVFVGANYVVTVHAGKNHVLDEALSAVKIRNRHDPGAVVHALLDRAVDGYFPLLDRAGESLDALEDAVVMNPGPDVLGALSRLKRTLLETRRTVGPQRDILTALLRGDLTYFDAEEMRFPLRDVYDHLLRISDMLDTYRDVLTGILDVYLSAVSNRINQVVNRLTAVTVVMGAAAVVTGCNPLSPSARVCTSKSEQLVC